MTPLFGILKVNIILNLLWVSQLTLFDLKRPAIPPVRAFTADRLASIMVSKFNVTP